MHLSFCALESYRIALKTAVVVVLIATLSLSLMQIISADRSENDSLSALLESIAVDGDCLYTRGVRNGLALMASAVTLTFLWRVIMS
jgi:hypothetical protein